MGKSMQTTFLGPSSIFNMLNQWFCDYYWSISLQGYKTFNKKSNLILFYSIAIPFIFYVWEAVNLCFVDEKSKTLRYNLIIIILIIIRSTTKCPWLARKVLGSVWMLCSVLLPPRRWHYCSTNSTPLWGSLFTPFVPNPGVSESHVPKGVAGGGSLSFHIGKNSLCLMERCLLFFLSIL